MSAVYLYHVEAQAVREMPPHFHHCLRPADWQHIHRLHRDKPQRIRQYAYATAYWLLSKHQLCPVSSFSLQRTAWGKPYVQPLHSTASPWHFNLSHSGNHIVIALAQVPVGVDIEAHCTIQTSQLHALCLHPSEHPATHSNTLFFDYWVSKEALVKAHGTGLRIQPDHIALHTPSTGFKHVNTAQSPSALHPYQFALLPYAPAHHAGAVALRSRTPTIAHSTVLNAASLHQLLH